MKLKGIGTKRLSRKKKEKMEKTLKSMGKNREQDNLLLRDKIQQEIKELEQKQAKWLEIIKKYDTEIEKLQVGVLQVKGAIFTLKKLLESKKENPDGQKH